MSASDQLFWVLMSRSWSHWKETLVIVKPDTVVRWHRAGFRLYWRWKSRRGKKIGRPPIKAEIRDLIRKMATENGWGAPRIHGELKMLGLDISERTVSRYLRGLRRRPEARPSWLTFLRNHREVIAAMDLFVVCTVTFRLLYVLFVIRHGRRQIVHFNVTQYPTAAWVVQQVREAFPFDSAPKYFIFDRDSTFSAEVVGAVKAVGAEPTRTAYGRLGRTGPRNAGSVVPARNCSTTRSSSTKRTSGACSASTSALITTTELISGSRRKRPLVVRSSSDHRRPQRSWRCRGWAGCITGTPGERRRSSPSSPWSATSSPSGTA